MLALDPTSFLARVQLGRLHALEGRHDAADGVFAGLEVDGGDTQRWGARLVQLRQRLWTGTLHEAPHDDASGAPPHVARLLDAYREAARTGRVSPVTLDALRAIVDDAHPRARFRPHLLQLVTELAVVSGERARAWATLEAAVAAELFDVSWMEGCPALAGLRGELAFAPLLARVQARAAPVVEALRAPRVDARVRALG